ncbi:MAG: hypothetical protein J7M17_03815 [Anaerolineae bacterium]|nr:hypothetical protein [Anaerolineae bacterium]
MKVQDYFRILRQRGMIILLTAALTASSALIFSKLQTPVYRSSIELSIQPARIDWGQAQTVKILLDSYVTVINTRAYAQAVIEELGLMRTPEDLKSDVIIASDSQNLTIQIDVDDYDGEQANRIAKAWANELLKWRKDKNDKQRKEDRVFATVVEEPTYYLLRPKWKINTAAGGIFGLLLGVGVVLLLEWLEAGLVRTPHDLERETQLTVLGIIPPADVAKK